MTMKPDPLNLYIVAGCNGAGKTTASMTVLPEVLECEEFVNADEIARGLSPFHPETVAVEAGKLMLMRIEQLLSDRKSFAIETTLATRCYKHLVARAQSYGYTVTLIFFWLPSPEMAECRVAARVASGGHGIPGEVIHRRYWRGIGNLFGMYADIVDRWSLYDNSQNVRPIVELNEIVDSVQLSKIKTICRNKKK